MREAEYLCEKGYTRAAAALMGASLEEALRSRAKAIAVEVTKRDTLVPLLHKLKASTVGVITEVQSMRLEAVARIRNDAAHAGDFNHSQEDVEKAIREVQIVIDKILGGS